MVAAGHPPPSGALLETHGLVKRFGGLVAVDGLSLGIRAGEVRGLIGPNGSGKTTTINLLSGLYRADGGEIRLRGDPIDHLRPHEIAARGVARTFQIPKLWGNMTVLENVLVPALAEHERGAGRPMAEVLDQARRLLLRAYVRRRWGLPGGSYRDVAARLTEAGYPTTEQHFKNALRAKGDIPEHVIPADAPGISEFIAAVEKIWPEFEWRRLVKGEVENLRDFEISAGLGWPEALI